MQKQIVSSSIWMFLGNISQQGLQFLVFILLARQLLPETFGYVALASVVVDIACTVGGWGLIDYMTQRPRVSKYFVSHIFTFAVLLGVALSGIVVLGVGIYSIAHEFTLVSELILWMIPIVVLQSLGLIPDALIRRRLDFKWLALRNNMAALLAGAVAVTMAYTGLGVYALVAQKLVALTVLAGTVWIASGREIRLLPLQRYRFRLFANIFQNGFKISSQGLFTMISNRIVDAIVGLYLGAAALGQFKIIMRVYEMITQMSITPVATVAFSALPKLARDRAALSQAYNQMLEVCMVLYVPALVGLGLTAPDWVPLVLSDKWLDAIPSLQILSLICIGTVFLQFQNPLFLALQKNSFLLKQSTFKMVFIVVLCLIAAQFSVEAVVAAFIVQYYVLVIYNMFVVRRDLGRSLSEDFALTAPSTIAVLGMSIAVLAVETYARLSIPAADLAIAAATGAAVYTGIFLLFFRRHAVKLIGGAAKMLKREAPDAKALNELEDSEIKSL